MGRIMATKRLIRERPIPPAPNDTWPMDFMADQLSDGQSFRTPSVLEDFDREDIGIEVDVFLPALVVARTLDWTTNQRGKPKNIRVDKGPVHFSCTSQT